MSRARLRRSAVIAAFVLGMCSSIVTSPVGGEPLPATMLAASKTGTVDAVYASAVRINGTEYRVQAGAKIMDHKENEITLEEVFLRSEAKFHLNKIGEIDVMVVTRPQ